MTLVEPADALLVIDVGNSRLGFGVWDGDGLHDARRVPVTEPETWEDALQQTWEAMTGDRRAIVIGSVNPQSALRVQELVERFSGLHVLRVGDDLPLPMPLDIQNTAEIGVDRVCAAAAAFERIGGACAIASFGTAVTVDCVDDDGRFLGGAILPGFQMAFDALHDNTAQLPQANLTAPKQPFGKNTHEAIANGVAFGLAGALREIVERFATSLGQWPHLVITGGNAPVIAELTDFVDAVVPDLCLMGVALAHRRAAGQA